MHTAKLFMNGRSQAVRLPKTFRFSGKEVYIKRIPEGILLMSKEESIWDAWEDNLLKHDTPFLLDRQQPTHQERDGLDELFD